MLVTLDFYFLFLFSCNVSGINKHCQEIILLIKFASFIQKTHRGMLHFRKKRFYLQTEITSCAFSQDFSDYSVIITALPIESAVHQTLRTHSIFKQDQVANNSKTKHF